MNLIVSFYHFHSTNHFFLYTPEISELFKNLHFQGFYPACAISPKIISCLLKILPRNRSPVPCEKIGTGCLNRISAEYGKICRDIVLRYGNRGKLLPGCRSCSETFCKFSKK